MDLTGKRDMISRFSALMPVLFAGVILTAAFARPVLAEPFVIGVQGDCEQSITEAILPKIKAEVEALAKGEFDVRFPASKHLSGDCSMEKSARNIDRLLNDPEVDLVITMDPGGSHLAATKPALPKPVIASFVLNSKLQKIPFREGRSGKENLTYVLITPNLKENIAFFRQLVPFKRVALIDGTPLEQKIYSRIGDSGDPKEAFFPGLTFVPVQIKTGSVKEQLAGLNVDAAFIGMKKSISHEEFSKIAAALIDLKIPGFTTFGKEDVENGLLAGIDKSDDEARYARRIALLVQRVLLKEKPEEFPVSFSFHEKPVINMDTARKLNLSPGFDILNQARLINQVTDEGLADPLAAPVMTKEPEPRQSPVMKPAVEKEVKVATSDGSDKMVSPDATLKVTSKGATVIFKDEAPIAASITEPLSDSVTLSLQSAVQLALENNLALKSRQSETAAGAMDVKTALSYLYPQVGTGLAGVMVDEDNTSALAGVSERSWNIFATLNQVIYSDKALTNYKTSRHLQKALELGEQQVRLDIILETGISYLNVLNSRALARIQHENLQLIRSYLALAKNRYQAGYSGPSDVYRFQSEDALAHTNYLGALARIRQSKIHLNQILDQVLETNFVTLDLTLEDELLLISDRDTREALSISNPNAFAVFRDFYVQKGLEQSPELLAVDEQIQAQEKLLGYSKRAFWSPDVAVYGQVKNTFDRSGANSEFNFSSLPDPLDDYLKSPEDTYWEVGVSVTFPLYQGGAKSALKVQSLETLQQLKYTRSQLQNQVAENIRLALHAAGASYPSIALARAGSQASMENLKLVQDAYSQGAVSIVNLLDAQNAALVAKEMAENAFYDFMIDYLNVERASGQFSLLMSSEERQAWVEEFRRYQLSRDK